MAPRITHTKVSGKAAGTDTTRIYGTHWDADHTITGLTIGTDVQAHDTTLDGLAALAGPTGIVAETAADTFGNVTLTGTANRIAVTNGTGAGGNPTFDIDLAYVGQATITTLGTVTTGTWSATAVAETKGGTNQTTYTLGDILYASASNTLSKLAGQITATRKFLRQTGNGAVSAAPAWDTIVAADVPGSALTKTDDTNVTLTLGGSASTSLLNAASITVGWTGTLSGTRGGTGVNNGASTITLGGNLLTSADIALPAITQGDILYGSSAGTVQRLAKSTSAKRYLANTAANNNPQWDQVDLATGVTGLLPLTTNVTGALPIANGGTAQITALAARGSSGLNVEGFTGHGDSVYAILATDRVVGTNAAFTASRTWTLPAANAVNTGGTILVADFQGTVGATNTLVIARAGADTINGGTSVTISGANGSYLLISDGSSKWTAQALGTTAGVTSVGGSSGVLTVAGGVSVAGSVITGTTKQVMVWNPVSVPGNSTHYLSPSTFWNTATQAGINIPFAGTAKNLYVNLSSDPGNTQTYVFTVYINGSATGITCTVTGNGSTNVSASDLTHTASITAGQLLTIQEIGSAGAATVYMNITLEMDNAS